MKNLQIEGSGTYQVIVTGADGKIRYKSKEFKNLIVDQGIDRFMGSNRNDVWDEWGYCGTGGTAPVASNTSMQAFLAETNDRLTDDSESVYSTAPRYMVRKITYTFPVGAVVGNVAEVGVGWKVSTTRLVFSRSLVVDGGGTPTTITVLASEQLTLIYRLYVKIPDSDIVFNVTDNGVTYTVTQRQNFASGDPGFTMLRYGFWGSNGTGGTQVMYAKNDDTLPAIDGSYSTSGSNNTSTVSLGAYVSGSFTRSATYTFSGATANFTGGIGSTRLTTGGGVGHWMHSYSPKIAKIAGQSLTFSFNYTFVRGTPP